MIKVPNQQESYQLSLLDLIKETNTLQDKFILFFKCWVMLEVSRVHYILLDLFALYSFKEDYLLHP